MSLARLGRMLPFVRRKSRSHFASAVWWSATCSSSAMFLSVAEPSLDAYSPVPSELRATDAGGETLWRPFIWLAPPGGPPNIRSFSGEL